MMISNMDKLKFKTIILFLFFVTLVANITAQNYIEYQRGITKAENLMFDSLFSESVKQYRKTFDAYEFNFPRDCMVAAQVASHIKDDSSAFYFLRKAVRFGASIERIEIVYKLKRLQKSPLWKPFLVDYDFLRKLYRENLNWSYRELCNKYFIKDQVLDRTDQAPFNNRNFVWKPRLRKKWMNNCREALHVVDSLIPIYGFPSYRTIGVVDSTTPPLGNNALTGAQILIIYYHIDLVKEIPKYTRYLYDEVAKGNLNARDYATIMEFDRRSQKNYTRDSSIYYVRWEPVLDSKATYANEDELNKRREAIGLSTCYYERMRKIWELKYGFELFYYEF